MLLVLGGVTAKDLNRLQQRNAELEKQLQLEREEAVGLVWFSVRLMDSCNCNYTFSNLYILGRDDVLCRRVENPRIWDTLTVCSLAVWTDV